MEQAPLTGARGSNGPVSSHHAMPGADPSASPGQGPGNEPAWTEAKEDPADPYTGETEPDELPPVAAPEPEPEPEPEPGPEPEPAESGPSGRLSGILTAHNRYRAQHCAPPLTWSKEVAASAQRWASKLRDQKCAFDHDPDTDFGENLAFFAPRGSSDADKVVAGWYSEVKSYDFARPRFGFDTGHFTQVVWVGTTQLGCGMAECRNAELWVCRYNPPGNFERQFEKNVLPTSCSKGKSKKSASQGKGKSKSKSKRKSKTSK